MNSTTTRRKDHTKKPKDKAKGLPQIIIDSFIPSSYYQGAIMEAVRYLNEYRRSLARVVIAPHSWARGMPFVQFIFTCWFLKKECETVCNDYCDCTFAYIHDCVSRNGKIFIIPEDPLPSNTKSAIDLPIIFERAQK